MKSKSIREKTKKKKHLKGANLIVISPSAWLGKLAKESEVFKNFEVKKKINQNKIK